MGFLRVETSLLMWDLLLDEDPSGGLLMSRWGNCLMDEPHAEVVCVGSEGRVQSEEVSLVSQPTATFGCCHNRHITKKWWPS